MRPRKGNSATGRSEEIRILLAEDHALVRAGVAAMLATQPDLKVIAKAASGREAVELFERHCPDVTLMDLRMPELDGPAATREIRQKDGAARILILTAYEGQEDIYRAMDA